MPVLKNSKHEIFAQEIAKGATLDAAYVSAGYAPSRKNAQRLRTIEGVSSRIEEILSQSAQRCGVTVDRITEELAKIGFADIRRAVRWGDGVVVKDEDGNESVIHDVCLVASDKIDAETAAAISEVRKTKDGLSIKFHDKQAALVNLGRNLGMFKDKVEHSGGVTINIGKEFEGL